MFFSALPRPLRTLTQLSITVLAVWQLSACAPLVVGGAAATTAVVATDRRTAGEQVDDKTIEIKANAEATQILGDKPGRVSASSYGGQVLLLGDVPTQEDSQKIEAAVQKIERVNKVINRLRVGPVTELGVRTNDSWITTKVTSTLINTKDVPSRTINVTTERGVVYLQGRVTQAEGDRAAQAAARVKGVNQVVKLFDYVSAERVLLPQSDSTGTASPSQSAPATTTTSPSANQPEVFTIN